MKYETTEQAKTEIQLTMAKGGQFVHNIVSSILRQVATDFGVNKANGIVDSLKLTKKLGIQKVKE